MSVTDALTQPPITIAVLLKFTVDVNQLRVNSQTLAPDFEHAPIRINEFDENAIEEAVRIKEKFGGRVVGISLVNKEPPRDVILRALANGLTKSHWFLISVQTQVRACKYLAF